jgi:Rho GDP-dissociation inhibitor/dynein assembly factor 5
VKKLALCVPDRPDLELDLTGDISQLKKQVKTIILRDDWCYVCCM